MTAQIVRLSFSTQRTGRSSHVSAQVVVLSERRASVSAGVTMDPLVAARRWWDFWAGAGR